jgi:hypothetical protein
MHFDAAAGGSGHRPASVLTKDPIGAISDHNYGQPRKGTE